MLDQLAARAKHGPLSSSLASARPLAPTASLASGFSLALVASLALGACAGNRTELARRKEATEARLQGEPRVAAAAAEVDAAAAESGPSVVDELELRLGSQLGTALGPYGPSKYSDTPGGSLEVAGRLPLQSPFEVAASARARDAAVEGAVARLEGVALEVEGERCTAAIAHAAFAERKALHDALAAKLGALLAWNDDWSKAGSLDELAAARLELEAKRLVDARAPRPVPEALPPEASRLAHPLPPLESPAGTLSRAPEELRAALARDPAAAGRAAAWARYEALSDQAFHASLPWLSFVQLGFSPNSPARQSSVSGLLAIAVPLGTERGEGERLAAEGIRVDKELEARELLELRRVEVALEEQALFEEQLPRLRELLVAAARGEQIAERWLAARQGEPSKVGALFEQSFEAKAAVLAARERAGLAGCALLGMTGVPVASWKREP